MTNSLRHWLWENHREKLPLIMLGHIELLTDDMYNDYLQWCETDEGKKYIEGDN